MSERSPSDAELVRGIEDGSDASGAVLFEKYSRRVYYLALRDLRSHADAEDARAETFFRVFKAIQAQQVRSPDMLSSFILGTVRNVVLEILRSPLRAAQEREVPDRASPEAHRMLDQDVTKAIESTLTRLKPREREVLRLYFYEELPKEEIARRIGVDEERVRLVKSRALRSFREMYERLKKIADTKRGRPSLKV